MSTLDSTNPRLSRDDRYELAARAKNQQRMNHPTHLVVLGIILVVVALVVLAVAWRTRAAAATTSAREAQELVSIENLIEQIRAIETAQNDAGQADIFQPMPEILSRLQSYGQRAGLENDVGLPQNPNRRVEGNALLRTYPYTVRDPSLESLLGWLRIAQREIPGLEVRELELQPGNQYWTMTVVLSRYERNE